MADRLSYILKKILPDSIYNRMIINWTQIVGKKNRNLIFPLKIKDNILYLAVDNSMVKTYMKNVLPLILKKIHKNIPRCGIDYIKLVVRPEFFTEKKRELTPEVSKMTISSREVGKRTEKLILEGISESHAEKMAEIEVLIESKKNLSE